MTTFALRKIIHTYAVHRVFIKVSTNQNTLCTVLIGYRENIFSTKSLNIPTYRESRLKKTVFSDKIRLLIQKTASSSKIQVSIDLLYLALEP